MCRSHEAASFTGHGDAQDEYIREHVKRSFDSSDQVIEDEVKAMNRG